MSRPGIRTKWNLTIYGLEKHYVHGVGIICKEPEGIISMYMFVVAS